MEPQPSSGGFFFDIHFHAFNLSHLNFSAYLHNLRPRAQLRSRMKAIYVIKMAVYMAQRFIFGLKKGSKLGNLVSLMENDIGMFFLLLDKFLKTKSPDLFHSDNTISMGPLKYRKFILTPLMIDFYYPSTFTNICYDNPPRKPLAEQSADLLKGIRDYYQNDLDPSNRIQPALGAKKLFSIHPFLGINTRNYSSPQDLLAILDRHFADYAKGRADALHHPDNSAIFFAGIKVYPPLGFDPWPEEKCTRQELEKVETLYDYCVEKGIPITSHCQEMGIDIDARARELVHPDRWRKVLVQPRYFNLKVNLAHFGHEDYWFYPKRSWEKKIIALINERPNVYTDIAFRGFDVGYYKYLAALVKDNPLLGDRLLFGSDFLISLIEQNSYNDYLSVFARAAQTVDTDFMNRMCSVNPRKFIFDV